MERVALFRLYLQEVMLELKKVVWPTRKDTMTVTMVVFSMVVLISLFLWFVDWILSSLVALVVG